MSVDVDRFWARVQLGEDTDVELKEVRFRGRDVIAPRRRDLADGLAAFASAAGGWLVLGVSDDRTPQPLDASQLDAVVHLVTEICSDSIEPALHPGLHRMPLRETAGTGVLLVRIPPGASVHRSPGGYLRRRGAGKRQMESAEIRRLLQARGQSDVTGTDLQVVANTSVNSLRPELWRRYASSRASDPPETALSKLKFLKAVCYDSGKMDGNRQLDAQDIAGALDQQIRDAMRFVIRNRKVAARKQPARTDFPQYSDRAVFEAVVNAVVHRDYAISGSRIRLFMFDDRLELYSPGGLSNSLQIEDLRTSQFTRNELLASRLGQCPVGDVPGLGGRRYFIERRGEGIGVIEDETFAVAGRKPVFELIGERELKLTLPAAKPPLPEGLAARVAVRREDSDEPLRDVHVLLVYPNKTYLETRTDPFGFADFELHSRLPMTVLCSAPGFLASVDRGYRGDWPLDVRMRPTEDGGSLIIANRTGHLPGIRGRLNPILDNLDRSYLYAENVAINDGMQQPVRFSLGEPVRLTDSVGAVATLWFREMVGASSVLDHRYG